MKTIFVVFMASAFLFSGIFNVLRHIKITETLDEIVSFINLAKAELHYRTADYEHIYMRGKEQNYNYLSFSGDEIYINDGIDTKLNEEFKGFIKRIGTTDETGQINLCEEYKSRFEDLLISRKSKEKEKLQVNTALSVFGALSVLIFFL